MDDLNNFIVIDFEFDGIDIHNAELIEFCCLYVVNGVLVDEISKKVKYLFKFDELNKSKKEGLKFNKITSQKDLDEHNGSALEVEKILTLFLEKLKKNFENKKVPVIGWNHASDMCLLWKLFDRYKIDKDKVLDYHIVDVGSMFRPFYHKLFERKFKFKLENTHQHLIGTFKKEDFHIAKNDCIATLDIYYWIKKELETKLRN